MSSLISSASPDDESSVIKSGIQRCFSGESCNRCGACCNYLTDQFIPDRNTAIQLKNSYGKDIHTILSGFLRFKRFGCTFLGSLDDTGGTKTCTIHDLKNHPSVLSHGEMLHMCRNWSAKTDVFPIEKKMGKRKLTINTSQQDELLGGIAEHIILPPSNERFSRLVDDFENGLFEGVEHGIKTKISEFGMRLLKGGGLFPKPADVLLADWLLERYLDEGIMPHEKLFTAFGIDDIIQKRLNYHRLIFWSIYGLKLVQPHNKSWYDYIQGLTKKPIE